VAGDAETAVSRRPDIEFDDRVDKRALVRHWRRARNPRSDSPPRGAAG
jgi:hypothetical protein